MKFIAVLRGYQLPIDPASVPVLRQAAATCRPDRREVEAALQHIVHRVLAQRDWHDDQPTMGYPAAWCWNQTLVLVRQ